MLITLKSATRKQFHSISLIGLAFSLVLGAQFVRAQDADPAASPPPKPAKKTKASKKKKTAATTDTTTATTTETKAAETTTSPSLVKASGAEPEVSGPTGESLKFNTDSLPPNTDHRPSMRFNDPGETPLGSKPTSYADQAPEEAPFKTYIGYPKNQIGLYAMPETLGSTWSYNGQDFNFSNTPVALGLMYRLIVTPLWNLELDYSHYTMSVDQATVKPYVINSSNASFDQYYVKGHYCFIGKSTFYRQICPGVDVGNDAYPILKFLDGTHLQIDKVQDIILGLNLSYQEPFSERFLFKTQIGYNYGTGLGNSGALTSKNNSSMFFKAGVEYTLREHHIILADAAAMARTAKLSGKVGNNDDTWNTKSTLVGLKIGYLYSFF